MKKIYLAIPYSGMEEKSFKLANIVAGSIIERGDIPFSPISHSHPIALECDIKGNWDTWQKIDFSFIDWADEVLVIDFDSKAIENSVGVQGEIEYAKSLGIPVTFVKVADDNTYTL